MATPFEQLLASIMMQQGQTQQPNLTQGVTLPTQGVQTAPQQMPQGSAQLPQVAQSANTQDTGFKARLLSLLSNPEFISRMTALGAAATGTKGGSQFAQGTIKGIQTERDWNLKREAQERQNRQLDVNEQYYRDLIEERRQARESALTQKTQEQKNKALWQLVNYATKNNVSLEDAITSNESVTGLKYEDFDPIALSNWQKTLDENRAKKETETKAKLTDQQLRTAATLRNSGLKLENGTLVPITDADLTPEQKANVDKITSQIGADKNYEETLEKRWKELYMKPNRTPEETKELNGIDYMLYKSGKNKSTTTVLTPAQSNQNFMSISTRYQSDSIIKQAINGKTAVSIADQIIVDPKKATNQLASLYLLVKNLDPDSAVREGELGLAQQTQSYFQKFKKSLEGIANGQLLAPEAAKNLAMATKNLVTAWNKTAEYRKSMYQSQANSTGVGEQFKNYLGGFDSSFSSESDVPVVGGTFKGSKVTNVEEIKE